MKLKSKNDIKIELAFILFQWRAQRGVAFPAPNFKLQNQIRNKIKAATTTTAIITTMSINTTTTTTTATESFVVMIFATSK